jgi:hypothetical protein
MCIVWAKLKRFLLMICYKILKICSTENVCGEIQTLTEYIGVGLL